jgi:hypothetical protein
MSDHFPCIVSVEIFLSKDNRKVTDFEYCDFNDNVMLGINRDLLLNDLSVISDLNVNESYNFFDK